MRRLNVLIVVTALFAATLGGCGGGDQDTRKTPEPLPSTSASTNSTAATGNPTAAPWAKKFTPDQLSAYTEALATFSQFQEELVPLYNAGKATPEAKKVFQRYFPNPTWKKQFLYLRTLEQNDVHTAGSPTVLRSEATKIPALDVVLLRQCVDYTTQAVFQHGKRASNKNSKPQMRTAELDHTDRGWLIYQLDEPANQNQERPC